MKDEPLKLNLKFKVWLQIEACDDENDFYEDVSPFPVCLGEYKTIDQADMAIMQLTGKSSLR